MERNEQVRMKCYLGNLLIFTMGSSILEVLENSSTHRDLYLHVLYSKQIIYICAHTLFSGSLFRL
jgi:hypothetical protein